MAPKVWVLKWAAYHGSRITTRRPGWAYTDFGVYIAMTFQRRVVTVSRSRKIGRYPEARWANCAFWTIQGFIALLALLLVHPSLSLAANPDLETVLTGSRQRIEKL